MMRSHSVAAHIGQRPTMRSHNANEKKVAVKKNQGRSEGDEGYRFQSLVTELAEKGIYNIGNGLG
jgi:hypothetical protein